MGRLGVLHPRMSLLPQLLNKANPPAECAHLAVASCMFCSIDPRHPP